MTVGVSAPEKQEESAPPLMISCPDVGFPSPLFAEGIREAYILL